MKTKDFTDDKILNLIYQIRGQRVMLDFDLANLYRVETKRLKEAVRRNIDRFPEDFIFEMSQNEYDNSQSEISVSNVIRSRPYCFTEQGVTMLACVLNSPTAVQMNIRVIRLFSKMREAISTHREILSRLDLIEKRVGEHDDGLIKLFQAIHLLLKREEVRVRTKSIGFNKDRG